jgi:competence protein ComEC
VTTADWSGIGAEGPDEADARTSHWADVKAEVRAQGERLALWAPVAAGLGAAGYFALSVEPPSNLVLVLAFAAVAATSFVVLRLRSQALTIAAVLACFAVLGFAVASLRTYSVIAPVVPAGLGVVTVEGFVLDVVSASAERPRMLIAPTYIQGLTPQATPARIRIAVREGLVGPGQAIRVRALLNPPPPPSAPGAYDFARDAFFDKVGGSGLGLGRAQIITLIPPPLRFRLGMAIDAARWSLARRLVDKMGPRTGGLAAALVTGHQAWLGEDDVQAMRDSGLAHILSISGVHMAIVGGFLFAGIRLVIAAWPWLALRVPAKKVAAAGALLAVIVYLVISGQPPPAQRAAITAGVAFAAVLLGRRALTLHSLAIAALVVIALQPEAVAQPGFQMSFAATAALLALAEAWPRPSPEIDVPWQISVIQRLGAWLTAAFLISFVAGMATGPFAVQHFNRVTLWGLPANLATEALSSLVVLPALAIGSIGVLLGGGDWALAAADWGLTATADIAHVFAGLPKAVVTVASAPAWTLPVSFLGLLFVCLWNGRLRWLGLIPFAAVTLAPRPPTPAAWIAAEGANAAIVADGQAVPLRTSQKFGYELWSRRRGFEPLAKPQARIDALFDCGRDACTPHADTPVKLAGWWRRVPPRPEQIAGLCAGAEVVVLRTGEGSCPGVLVLGQRQLGAGGSAELYRVKDGWKVVWAQPMRGRRPWSVQIGEAED